MSSSTARLCVLAMIVVSVSCTDELPSGAHRFAGTAETASNGDLAPLWQLVGDARLIGLGESIHTSGGFYAAKRRLIRALIEDHGVRVVAFETPRGRARALDRYLTGGDCDRPARDVLGIAIFEVFSDDNTYALMRWICERNARAPDDPVRLFGFDIQQLDEDSAEIASFVARWAGEEAAGLQAGIETCAVDYAVNPTEPGHSACLAGLDAIAAWYTAHQTELAVAVDERTRRLFEIASVGYRAGQRHFFFQGRDRTRGYEARDVGMGAVFKEVLALDYPPTARVAIWAANYHLTMDHERVAISIYATHVKSFGSVVAEAFGADYAAVAITGYAPGTNWPQLDRVTDHSELGTAAGSVEARLHALGEPYLIIDPRAAFLEPDEAKQLSEEIMVPAEQYAAILYLDSSPPMNAVFW